MLKSITMKEKFYLTFGNKYKHQPHPSGTVINPDGYVLIQAYTYDEARAKAFEVFGPEWAFLYTEDNFEAKFFPAGVLRKI